MLSKDSLCHASFSWNGAKTLQCLWERFDSVLFSLILMPIREIVVVNSALKHKQVGCSVRSHFTFWVCHWTTQHLWIIHNTEYKHVSRSVIISQARKRSRLLVVVLHWQENLNLKNQTFLVFCVQNNSTKTQNHRFEHLGVLWFPYLSH